jgi:hypothetical protein
MWQLRIEASRNPQGNGGRVGGKMFFEIEIGRGMKSQALRGRG